MTPHSYSIDSQAKSSELSAKILSANAPPQIAVAIAAVEAHLNSHFPEQYRHFFSIAFPALICKVFGFDDSSSAQKSSSSSSTPSSSSSSTAGWIDTVSFSGDPELSGKLFKLLSPTGTLMNLIMAVDRLSLVKYVFPVERLPEWVRFMLSSQRDCQILADVCSLFKGRIKEDEMKGTFQVQLNVFEYFMFWFAYYPVCRGKSENLGTVSIRRSRKFSLENWTSSIPVLTSSSKRTPEQKKECNLYLRLLHTYLQAFVPMDDLNAHQPYRVSLLHYSTSYDDFALFRAEFLVNTLVHYWMVDNDFLPLSANASKSFGLSFPFRSVLGEAPPASGLGEAVLLFVKYLNISLHVVTEGPNHAEIWGNSAYKKFGSGDVVKTRDVGSMLNNLSPGGSWNSYIQRPLYRFILRTFLFCPVESSMKNISGVFSVWISYITPWLHSKEELAELDALVHGSKKHQGRESGQSNQHQYSRIWEGYVSSNYLFYSSMVMHFIGFAHKFLHTDAETIVKMVSKAIDILTSSRELVELIKNVDTVFHSKNVGSGKSMLSSLTKFVPQIREQLKDWEDGLGETDADGSFLHENWNIDLKLFNEGEDGGPHLLQLFILRAETELPSISSDNLANNLQCLASLKSKLRFLFGDNVVKQPPLSPGAKLNHPSRDELFKPRRVGSGSTTSIKYKGDWMKRPITEDEVAWIAKLLIQLSNWVNKILGLDQVEDSQHDSATFTYVDVPSDVMIEYGMPETLKAIVLLIASWFLMLRLVITRTMVRHGLRVNLRVFASKKFVMVVMVFFMFSMLRRAFRSIC